MRTVRHQDYEYLLKAYSFYNLIIAPTCITTMSASSINHALTNVHSGVHAEVVNNPIADHLPVCVTVDSIPTEKHELNEQFTRTFYYSVLMTSIMIMFPLNSVILLMFFAEV